MTRAWKQILAACVVGGVIGGVGVRCSVPYMLHRHRDGARFQARLLQRFSSTLNLTPGQRTQVAAILQAKRQKIEALRGEIQPRFKELRASTAAEIRQLLTPEQQRTFDVMQAKWDARIKQWRHGEPGS